MVEWASFLHNNGIFCGHTLVRASTLNAIQFWDFTEVLSTERKEILAGKKCLVHAFLCVTIHSQPSFNGNVFFTAFCLETWCQSCTGEALWGKVLLCVQVFQKETRMFDPEFLRSPFSSILSPAFNEGMLFETGKQLCRDVCLKTWHQRTAEVGEYSSPGKERGGGRAACKISVAECIALLWAGMWSIWVKSWKKRRWKECTPRQGFIRSLGERHHLLRYAGNEAKRWQYWQH